MLTSSRPAPYRHADGSNCWTKNCSLNNSNVIDTKEAFIKEWFEPVSLKPEDKALFLGSNRVRRGVNAVGDTSLAEYRAASEAFDASLDKDEVRALNHYMMNGFEYVNPILRGGDQLKVFIEHETEISKYHHTTEEEYLERSIPIIAGVDKALSRYNRSHSTPEVLYKAFKVRPLKGETSENAIRRHVSESYRVGDIIENKGYTSTSIDSDYMLLFAERDTDLIIIHEIVSKRGVPVEALGGSAGVTAVEHEVLLPRSSKFRVVNVMSATYESSYTPDSVSSGVKFFFKRNISRKKFVVVQMIDETV